MDDQKTNRYPSLSANEEKQAPTSQSALDEPDDGLARTLTEEAAEGEDGEEDEDDPFKTWMAILIAIVTLVGAWMGFITAEVSGSAGWSTSVGIDAAINAEMTLTLNSIGLYKHYRAYTDYTRYQTLSDLMSAEAENSLVDGTVVDRIEADDLAAVQLPFFLSRYLTRDGGYHSPRELGEAWAEAEQKMDLYPEPSFKEANFYQLQTNRMTALFIVLAFSLVFYTLAETLHRERVFWRWSMGALGTLALIYCIWATLWIDLWMV